MPASFLAGVMAFAGVGVLAQGGPPQPAAGHGVIVGRVVEDTSDRGVAGAVVTLVPGGRTAVNPPSVLSGQGGAFVFRDLPAGAFALRVSMPGWLSGRPESVTLGDAEKITDAVLTLSRTGAISGQVVDEAGEGAEGITITLLTIGSAGGRRTFFAGREPAVTDDRGVYRFGSLAPGPYVVCALFSRHSSPLVGGASGSGYRVGDFAMISGSGARNVDPGPDESGRQTVFADACFGGGTSPGTAQPVVIESGRERTQVDLALRLVPAVSLVGTLVGPANRLAGQAVHLLPAVSDQALESVPELAYSDVDRNGRFGFVGVPAGSYVLKTTFSATGAATTAERMEIIDGAVVRFRSESGGDRGAQPAMWATAPVTVGETDVTDVALVLREAAKVSGQVVFDGAAPRPTATQLAAASVLFDANARYTAVQGWLTADAKFTAAGVLPGHYLVRMGGFLPGWSLKSIVADGVDQTDTMLDMSGGGDVSSVIVTMTDRPTHVSGVVHDATGAPDRRAIVAIFPLDRARWATLGAGRRAVTMSVSSRGEFDITSLPVGDYLVVAVSDRVRVDFADEARLATLAPSATHVTVRDAERTSVSLTTSAVR